VYEHGSLLLALALFTLSSNIPLLNPLLSLYVPLHTKPYNNLHPNTRYQICQKHHTLPILHPTTPIPPSLYLSSLISQHTKPTPSSIRKHNIFHPIPSRTSPRFVQTTVLVYCQLNKTSKSISPYPYMHGLLWNYYAYYQHDR
jgi:hypothetical protein